MTMRLDARLRSIAEFVPRGSRVADIGTDHAQLAIELIASGRATHVIAADLNAGPLDAARKNIADAGLSKQIETRLGDGLKVLRAGEVDAVCMAGMGGALMCEILSDEITASIARLILQPMNVSDRVRTWLGQNGWGNEYAGQYSTGSAFWFEFIATFIFVKVVLKTTACDLKITGVVIGLTLAAIHILGMPITGVSVNPARSFGPAIMAGGTALHQLWLFLLAPSLAGLLAGICDLCCNCSCNIQSALAPKVAALKAAAPKVEAKPAAKPTIRPAAPAKKTSATPAKKIPVAKAATSKKAPAKRAAKGRSAGSGEPRLDL